MATLQSRNKWTLDRSNLQTGDIVLLKDTQVKRNESPMGAIVGTIPSHDGRIRKVDVKIIRQGTPKVYLRPITEVELLLSRET